MSQSSVLMPQKGRVKKVFKGVALIVRFILQGLPKINKHFKPNSDPLFKAFQVP